MAKEGVKRKLTAIISADVKDYSRLMEQDEAATVKTLTAYRETISSLIQQHRGRVVDSPGDNLLAEFASVVDAVQCAVETQELLQAKNSELPENRRMQFRIGVNLGDVIEEGNRIYGDGVNIASRIEAMAEPGGICISMSVYNQIKKKLVLDYEDMGEHSVKNISEPLRVYRVPLERKAAAARVSAPKRAKLNRWHWAALALAMVVIILAGALVIQHYFSRPAPIESASLEKRAYPLPDKPSIAVLPFDNRSGDPEQEYFADGMTDDLITALSKISGIFVISRNSVFTFKNTPVNIQQVAKELNVHYVLEGSVRRAGETIRVNAQLIDANTDHHLWAEKYDGHIEDVFSLQDNITRRIVSALSVKLTNQEQALISSADTDNIEAYDLFLKARNLVYQFTPESYVEASLLLKRATELDPNYSQAYSLLASIYWDGAAMGAPFYKTLDINWDSGRYLAISFLELAMQNPTPIAHRIAADVAMSRRQFKIAAEHARKAIELSPNSPEGYAALSRIFKDTQPEQALSYAKMEAKLDPNRLPSSLYTQAKAYFFMKNYEKTVELMERACVHAPNLLQGNGYLVAALAHLGREEEAQGIYLNNFIKVFPGHYPPPPEHIIYFEGIQKPEMADLLINGLMKAGLPAWPDSYSLLSETEKLSIEEVKEIVIDKTWKGNFWLMPSNRFLDFFLKNGKNTLKAGLSEKNREFGFDENALYIMKNIKGRKLKSYRAIYRNPNGNYNQKNEYIYVDEVEVASFSVLKNSE
jgi:TolB-like protein/class 3 adenylate cyclase